jgi:ATP-dependent DNA helicase RecG
MEYADLLGNLKNPEKEITELKLSFSEWEEIARTMAGFSTKRGGKIYVGVDRKGVLCGTTCNNEIKGRLQTLANNEIKPSANISIEVINHDSRKDLVIACIHVSKGNNVFSYKGVHYERRGDTNHPLTSDEIFELQKSIKRLYFDEMPAFSEERPALISDIDEGTVSAYQSEIKNINEQPIDLRRFLVNHSYLVDGGQQVKNAAIMIFGKEPQKFVPQLRVSMAIFGGKQITDSFVKKEFVGDIYEIFSKVMIEIQRNIKVYSFVEGAQRFDVPEYPLEVLRECLINSVVHRDYFDRNTETFIKIFTDRIEFANPASFPFENMTFEEIKKTKISKRRNPLISDFFESVGKMEKEGRGLSRIEAGMKEHGSPPPVFEVGTKTFMVVLKNSEDKNSLKRSPHKKIIDYSLLNPRQRILISFMNSNKGVALSRADYIKLLGDSGATVNNQTASRDLKELVKKNVLTRLGGTKGTRYLLT